MTTPTNEIMYTVGMIFRAIYPEDMPINIINMAPMRPVQALGLATKSVDCRNADQEALDHLMNKLPADLEDPVDGVSVGPQGSFWIGYYHWVAATRQAKEYGADELAAVGAALYGDKWQTNLARDLGLSDARRIRQWLKGERSIPPGIWSDIAGLLRHRQLITGVMLDKIVCNVF